jgi:arginase family enzyme
MDVQIIQVPYIWGDSSEWGHGPVHLIEQGLERELADSAGDVSIETISPGESFANEIQATFSLAASVARAVERASTSHRFPLILSGNCASCLGTLSGLRALDPLGVIWFDAHGDFNTPATTTSGFFDGMALAIATGLGWESMRRSIPAFAPVDEGHVAICGVRAPDPLERELLQQTRVSVAPAQRLGERGIDTVLPIIDRLHAEPRSPRCRMPPDAAFWSSSGVHRSRLVNTEPCGSVYNILRNRTHFDADSIGSTASPELIECATPFRCSGEHDPAAVARSTRAEGRPALGRRA